MHAPDISPVIFSIGPLAIRWYGLMYVIAFVLSTHLIKKRCDDGTSPLKSEHIDSLVTHIIIGMFIFARLFYVVIYNWDATHSFIDVIAVWKGGLSYHGAITGFCIAGWMFARKHGYTWLSVADLMAYGGSLGVFWGRIGNFINHELYGRVTDSPVGMIFKGGGPYPRHPSQLYQAFGEGLAVFFILHFFRRKFKMQGQLGAVYLILYGIARYIIEFFREADAQMGYYFGGTTTMGQILCIIMILIGIGLFTYVSKKGRPIEYRPHDR